MHESPKNSEQPDRADQVSKALSVHNTKAMRRLMKDRVRELSNPVKFDIDALPDHPPVTDRRKRRKGKHDKAE